MIDLTKYQEEIKQFYMPEVSANLLDYSCALLFSEVGEAIGLDHKRMRGDAELQDAAPYLHAVVLEMGDVLFALASIHTFFDKPFHLNQSPKLNAWSLDRIADYLRLVLQVNGSERSLSFLENNSSVLFVAVWRYLLDRPRAVDIRETARANIAKLTDRQNRGVLGGSGDNR